MRTLVAAVFAALLSFSAEADVVLVAGASGGKGQHLIRQLLDAGHEVRGLTRDPNAARQRTGIDIEWVKGDVRDPSTLSVIMTGVDYVQCAVGAREPLGPNRPEIVDYKGVTHLVDAVKEAGIIKRFVLLSSANVTIVGHGFNKGFTNLLIWKYLGEDYLRRSEVPYAVAHPPQLIGEPGYEAGIRLQQGDLGGPDKCPGKTSPPLWSRHDITPYEDNTTFEIFRDQDRPINGSENGFGDVDA